MGMLWQDLKGATEGRGGGEQGGEGRRARGGEGCRGGYDLEDQGKEEKRRGTSKSPKHQANTPS